MTQCLLTGRFDLAHLSALPNPLPPQNCGETFLPFQHTYADLGAAATNLIDRAIPRWTRQKHRGPGRES